ncbi:STAS domain-containing protein [Actinocorallia sp. A-T 12471]|uniref:STAS domain-containing protein n=1 Tax=Actinocorallia sp. A-T 12471 TaxID=3089813 RepID=UPI0029D0FEE5|nr:STAS domain-containing protein [Actinocorallia sp. A-T 12471]MDX6742045.1 STAS domain-containing protein [Actinocorallia sp. A-T 12471]
MSEQLREESAFRATTYRYDSHRLLLLKGPLDERAIAALEGALLPLLQEEPRTPLVVDMAEVPHVAEAAYPTLFEASRLAADRDVVVTFGCPPEAVMFELRAMGALRFMALFESLPDAVEAALTQR